jgi:hypothetical protein
MANNFKVFRLDELLDRYKNYLYLIVLLFLCCIGLLVRVFVVDSHVKGKFLPSHKGSDVTYVAGSIPKSADVILPTLYDSGNFTTSYFTTFKTSTLYWSFECFNPLEAGSNFSISLLNDNTASTIRLVSLSDLSGAGHRNISDKGKLRLAINTVKTCKWKVTVTAD